MNQNRWLPYNQQIRNIYQQIQLYFSEHLEIPTNKIFIQGVQEFQQKFLLERSSLPEQVQERLKPPYMLLNLSEYKIDFSKMNQSWQNGFEMQKFEKYQLYFQKQYMSMVLNASIFLQSRPEFTEFLMKLFGLFDTPVVTVKYQYNFLDKVPNDEEIKRYLQELLFYDTFTIHIESITDQSEYNFNVKLRELRLDITQNVNGYITTKYKWQSLLKEIELVQNLRKDSTQTSELDNYQVETTHIKISQNN